MIRRSIHQIDTIVFNMHLVVEFQIHEETTDRNTGKNKQLMIFKDLSIPLSIIDRTIRKKISKDIDYLNTFMNQLDLIVFQNRSHASMQNLKL